MPALLYSRYEFDPRDAGYVIRHDHYDDASVQETTVPVAGAPPAVVNYAALITKAQNALSANQTFLAIANPTAAQVSTQAKALTRQVNALIYFLLHELTGLDTTPGV